MSYLVILKWVENAYINIFDINRGYLASYIPFNKLFLITMRLKPGPIADTTEDALQSSQWFSIHISKNLNLNDTLVFFLLSMNVFDKK